MLIILYMMNFAKYYLKRLGGITIKENAEDAVQNAFVQIIKSIDKIDFNRDDKDLKRYIIVH
mgnify:CR=1 FL=1